MPKLFNHFGPDDLLFNVHNPHAETPYERYGVPKWRADEMKDQLNEMVLNYLVIAFSGGTNFGDEGHIAINMSDIIDDCIRDIPLNAQEFMYFIPMSGSYIRHSLDVLKFEAAKECLSEEDYKKFKAGASLIKIEEPGGLGISKGVIPVPKQNPFSASPFDPSSEALRSLFSHLKEARDRMEKRRKENDES